MKYMRYFLSWTIRVVGTLALALLVVGCSLFGGPSTAQGTPGTHQPTPPPITTTGELNATVNAIAQQVLNNIHQNGWNPQAVSKDGIPGGLYINWKMDNPALTNSTTAGSASGGNPQHDHDPQVDLLYLDALAQYHQLNPQDQTINGDISRITPVVYGEFKTYSLPKGWIYFDLLQAGQLLNSADIMNAAQAVAGNFYKHWYDPALGFVYNRAHTPGNYNTENTITAGVALIEAGMRWNQPDWVSAGQKTLDHTISAGLDSTYHMFYYSLIVGSNGQDQPDNFKAKPDIQSHIADALLTAYSLTHKQQYMDLAGQLLQTLYGSSGLWDQQRGGFYFALDMSNGQLLTSYKETRSQCLTLIALYHYDQLKPGTYTQQEQQLLQVITQDFYQSTYHGFFYRLTPDFKVFTPKVGQGHGTEDYFTTEAMGLAIQSLQQTEFSA